ncbi:MAG: hypothetical protein DPW18_01540 [Chloroflexi bacterium]|nr:hypothetical protein [Chloroflexota bacterium]MDL1943698.1 hypothetical protein [Chloroflexi bacterium CFX2]
MHAVQPRQRIRILTLQIAVADDADPNSVADEISELLSENGICSDASHILDWRYLTEYQPVVTASGDPEEGEVFDLLDFNLTIHVKE